MSAQKDISNLIRWGLSEAAIEKLGDNLHLFWKRYSEYVRSKTRDTSIRGYEYIRGLLTMKEKRNYAHIAQSVSGGKEDGQAMQHFMSNSPWKAQGIFDQIQVDIRNRPELQGGALLLDEFSKDRDGTHSAGNARQYLGRLGKVENGQVGVGLGYTKDGIWTLVDAQLHLPAVWFEAEKQADRKRCGIPDELSYQSLTAQGLGMIKQAQQNGLPFRVVCADAHYGSDSEFRAELAKLGLRYSADIKLSQIVYLSEPEIGVPETPDDHQGRPYSARQIINGVKGVSVEALIKADTIKTKLVTIRHTERGWLKLPCAALRVWTLTAGLQGRSEWLVLQQDNAGKWCAALSNAPSDTDLHTLVYDQHERYFIERTFEDAKSETGWDEFCAQKYTGWMHHIALDALALWFIAETKLNWRRDHPADPALLQDLGLDKLPGLSLANVRLMLQTVLPLPSLELADATRIVVKHLVNRSRSTKSRYSRHPR